MHVYPLLEPKSKGCDAKAEDGPVLLPNFAIAHLQSLN